MSKTFKTLEEVITYCHGGCSDVRKVTLHYHWVSAGPEVSISVVCADDTVGYGTSEEKFFANGHTGEYIETDHLLREDELEEMFDVN